MQATVRYQNDFSSQELKDVAGLRRQFFAPLQREWETGKGSIGIKIASHWMIILRNSDLGFVVLFQARRGNAVGDALRGTRPREGIGVPWGVEMSFPVDCFVEPDRAFRAVEYFLETGEKAPDLDWLSGDRIDTGEAP